MNMRNFTDTAYHTADFPVGALDFDCGGDRDMRLGVRQL